MPGSGLKVCCVWLCVCVWMVYIPILVISFKPKSRLIKNSCYRKMDIVWLGITPTPLSKRPNFLPFEGFPTTVSELGH